MSERETVVEPGAPQPQPGCVCRDIGAQIGALFAIPEVTRQHLRNARIEMLKAMRSVIDDRIDRLARAERRGTRVAID